MSRKYNIDSIVSQIEAHIQRYPEDKQKFLDVLVPTPKLKKAKRPVVETAVAAKDPNNEKR